jgi:hypothetical protein
MWQVQGLVEDCKDGNASNAANSKNATQTNYSMCHLLHPNFALVGLNLPGVFLR